MNKKISILAALNIHKGEDFNSPIRRCGYFLCLFDYYIRFCTPVWRLNGPTALVVLSSGKGRTVFNYCRKQLKNSVMLNTERKKDFPISPMAIKAMHSVNRPELIQSLYYRSIQQLINDFIVEMDAKNKAYYFILESGHFDAFSSYCKNERRAV